MQGRAKHRRGGIPVAHEEGPAGAVSLETIAEKLGDLRFRRAVWGADDRDVLNKIRRIDEMYRALYLQQEARYRALLEERDREVQELWAQLGRR